MERESELDKFKRTCEGIWTDNPFNCHKIEEANLRVIFRIHMEWLKEVNWKELMREINE